MVNNTNDTMNLHKKVVAVMQIFRSMHTTE